MDLTVENKIKENLRRRIKLLQIKITKVIYLSLSKVLYENTPKQELIQMQKEYINMRKKELDVTYKKCTG